jgi:hypothetical protein
MQATLFLIPILIFTTTLSSSMSDEQAFQIAKESFYAGKMIGYMTAEREVLNNTAFMSVLNRSNCQEIISKHDKIIINIFGKNESWVRYLYFTPF